MSAKSVLNVVLAAALFVAVGILTIASLVSVPIPAVEAKSISASTTPLAVAHVVKDDAVVAHALPVSFHLPDCMTKGGLSAVALRNVSHQVGGEFGHPACVPNGQGPAVVTPVAKSNDQPNVVVKPSPVVPTTSTTATPAPTNTPAPTDTPKVEPTDTPAPKPTDTPAPKPTDDCTKSNPGNDKCVGKENNEHCDQGMCEQGDEGNKGQSNNPTKGNNKPAQSNVGFMVVIYLVLSKGHMRRLYKGELTHLWAARTKWFVECGDQIHVELLGENQEVVSEMTTKR
jgi:hypothetical protein